jgi:hypothetical protein
MTSRLTKTTAASSQESRREVMIFFEKNKVLGVLSILEESKKTKHDLIRGGVKLEAQLSEIY